MHIDIAIEKLKDGGKISHESWPKDSYLQVDRSSGHVMFYTVDSRPFNMLPDILLTNNWYTLDGQHSGLDFVQALALMSQGCRLTFEDNDLLPDFDFIEMDVISKEIYCKKIIHRDFILDQKALFSTQWIELQ